MKILIGLTLAATGTLAAQTSSSEFSKSADRAMVARIIRAEDARAKSDSDLAALRAGLASANPAVRRFAVRSFGRLRRDMGGDVNAMLSDRDAKVRLAAADAVRDRATLLARLVAESDAAVRGQIAEALGRLEPADKAEATATAESIVAASRGAAPATMRGVVRGLFFLARKQKARGAFSDAVVERLRHLSSENAYVRAVGASALLASGAATPADVTAMLGDADPSVREKAVGAIQSSADAARAIRDPAPIVRYRALSLFTGRRLDCAPLLVAARDTNVHVALAAIDALSACPGAAPMLDNLAQLDAKRWHKSAHALLALAAAAPARAKQRIGPFLASDNFFVRTYAARAAARLGDRNTLLRLARSDAHSNVRADAVDALSADGGHAFDDVYLDALTSNDSQLLQAAAKALKGSRQPDAEPRLRAAFDRITALPRETLRDARVALVAAMRTAPDTAQTGLPVIPLPLFNDLTTLENARAFIEMEDSSLVVLRLFPFDAPTNVSRFARLARSEYFNGLTFHRVVPFFVVQGGSPGANEYMGDGPYTRDEVGLENRRGTVGLSTRGPDTGDGQLYFNTVDNVRLDHDYTVWGEVVSGMDVVDRMQEGAKIRRVTLRFLP